MLMRKIGSTQSPGKAILLLCCENFLPVSVHKKQMATIEFLATMATCRLSKDIDIEYTTVKFTQP